MEAAAADCEIHIDWRSKHSQVKREEAGGPFNLFIFSPSVLSKNIHFMQRCTSAKSSRGAASEKKTLWQIKEKKKKKRKVRKFKTLSPWM